VLLLSQGNKRYEPAALEPPVFRQPTARELYEVAFADFLYRLLKRSTRPAESTNFCFPVKNGWQFEQISTFNSADVDPVTNVLPQTHVTTDLV